MPLAFVPALLLRLRAGLAFDRSSMDDLLYRRNFYSCKDNARNVMINNEHPPDQKV